MSGRGKYFYAHTKLLNKYFIAPFYAQIIKLSVMYLVIL